MVLYNDDNKKENQLSGEGAAHLCDPLLLATYRREDPGGGPLSQLQYPGGVIRRQRGSGGGPQLRSGALENTSLLCTSTLTYTSKAISSYTHSI